MFSISSPPEPRFDNDVEGERRHGSKRGDAMDFDVDDSENVTSPGQFITSSTTFMRGHGTYVDQDEVLASVAGTIERVNKLVSVRALKSRYTGEIGDLVIGRITEVVAKRWRVDVFGRNEGVLMLSSVNLPGGVQRRKLESDELQMRTFFEEGDLLVAEVHQFFGDGSISLHTRSLRYGKLRNGQLITVSPMLIRRLKSHFVALHCGVDLIIGMNGYIWVSKHAKEFEGQAEEGFEAQAVYSNKNDAIDNATRTAISRVTNIIRILARHSIPLTDAVIAQAYDWAMEQDTQEIKDMLADDYGELMAESLSAFR
ncbi:exosome non-catalytic core subunit rrp4 [Tulasnella sp. 427]|nr:exosome non-catalytic core subunit rrp4 [Tulasnella sp. 427]